MQQGPLQAEGRLANRDPELTHQSATVAVGQRSTIGTGAAGVEGAPVGRFDK